MDTNCGCGSSLPGVARGNDFKVAARVSLYDEGTGKLSPLDLTSAEGVAMAVVGRFSRTEGAGVSVEGSRVTASFPWSLPCGAYGVEITFRDAAGRGRVFERAVFEVVDSVSDVSAAASEGDRQVAVDISVRTVYIGKGTEAGDYPSLSAKPRINGVELVGDKAAAAFGLADKSDIPDTSGLARKSEIPAKTSQLVNDSGFATRSDIDEAVSGKVDMVAGKGLSTNDYTDAEKAKVASALQSYTETDPTVPEWAKQPTKPKYTAEEVGALPEGTKIPSKTSDLLNDSGFLTQHQKIKTVNGQSLIGEGNITIEGGSGSSITVDSDLSDSSTNPAQNKAIKKAIDAKQDKGDYALKSEIPDISDLATKDEVSRVEGQAATNAANILNKVDKVDGKGLSSNDYTDEDKTKVGKALTEHQSLGNYYTKEEVDSKVAQGGTFDPTAYYNKHDVDSLVGGKVDKVEGKQLSSNDYTDDDKAKVQSAVQTYDASWVEEYHTNNSTVTEDLLNQLADAVTSGKKVLIVKDADTYQCVANIDSSSSSSLGKVINLLTTKYSIGVYFYRLAANRTVYRTTFNLSIDDAINGSSYNTVTNKAIYAALQDKQDIISDIETIRSGAAKGETALQSFTESDPLYTKDKPSLALKSEIPDVSGLANKTDIPDVSGLVKSSDLAEVATSGDYNDLANKPSIPSEVTEQTVSGWGFTKNSGTYSKPSGGIPKSDLSSAVQTSLGKADTALQGVPSTYRTAAVQDAIDSGKVDKVTGKGLSTNDYTDAEKTKVANALTSHQTLKTINGNSLVGTGDIAIGGGGGSYDASAIVAKASGADWGDITKAEFDAVAEAIAEKKAIWSKQTLETDRAAYTDYIQWLSYLAAEDEVYKQIVLYSCDGSCNDYIKLSLTDSSTYQIKRFYYDFPSKTSELTNDSGFITSSEVDTKIAAIPSVDRRVLNVRELYIGFGNTYFNGVNAITLSSTEFVIIGRSAGLNISLPDGSDADGKEYVCQFYVGDNGSEFTLTLPNSVIWLNGEAPTIESNACYTLSIVNHYAVIGVFKESS